MKNKNRNRTLGALTIISLLTACGGGGGSSSSTPKPNNSLRVTYSSTAISFNVPAPWSPKPADADFGGTLSGQGTGTLNIVILVNNPELFSVTDIAIDPGTQRGSMRVVPVLPDSLGSGDFNGSFDVRVCVNSPTCSSGQIQGSPQHVTVHYTVPSMLDADTVTPRVVPAVKAGSVVLRGHDFTNSTTVKFGSTNATAVTFVGSTELHVDFPALAAGDHVVTLNGGSLPFTGTLSTVAPVNFAAEFIPYSVPTPAFPDTVVYDAVRHALITNLQSGVPNIPKLVRYEYADGSWQAPTSVDIDGELQVRMSHDDSQLLALQPYWQLGPTPKMMELDPVTLQIQRSTDLNGYARSFALANDGNLIVSTKFPGSGSTSPIVFGINRRTSLQVDSVMVYEAATVARGDGGKVYLPGASNVAVYDASTGRWQDNISSDMHTGNLRMDPPDVNLASTRFRSYSVVYDENLQAIAYGPNEFARAVMNPDGTRLYVYQHQLNIGYLRTYDLTAPPVDGQFVEVGTRIQLAGAPGCDAYMGPVMTLTPDGMTIFIVGIYGIAVQPTPP